MKIVEINVNTALSKSGLPDLTYALNPYVGCYHGCLYCYARLYTRYSEVSENWGEVVYIKKNIVDMLKKEITYIKKGTVGLGTITDPYQPVEAVYKLSRQCIEVLVSRRFPVSIQTKNSLVIRDIDVLSKHRDLVDVGITITSIDNRMSFLEPRASPPWARIYALRKLSDSGVKTWIFYGPIVPGLNDDVETIRSLVELAKETNSVLYYDPIHVKPFMWRNTILSDIARRAREYDWKTVIEKIGSICREQRVDCRPGFGEKNVERHATLDTYFTKMETTLNSYCNTYKE